MTNPTLSLTSTPLADIDADVLVLAAKKNDDGPTLVSDDPALDPLRGVLAAVGVTGGRDEIVRLPSMGLAAKSLAVVGLGSGVSDQETLRGAAGTATRVLTGVDSIAISLPLDDLGALAAAAEGATLGAYLYDETKGRPTEARRIPASRIQLVTDLTDTDDTMARVETLTAGVRLARDLVNTPSDRLYPETLAVAAAEALESDPVTVTIMREEELKEGGFGGLLSVGQGSSRGPRLVKLEYAPEGARQHLAYVGKGITFDTGGLSLKPAGSMVGMKYDMAGAAAVLGAVQVAARLTLPVRITGWLCLAENMPSGDALRPNDVITVRGGTTIEVLNTDAEGRLVLADGLVAAGEEQPDAIIDVATLTGAAIVALGTRYSGLMGDEDLVARVRDAAGVVGEAVWPMPLPEELRSGLNSDVADIANARIGNSAAGMLLAGVFLKEFIGTRDGDDGGSIPWAHLDIAGTANNAASPYGYTGKGATGVAVRTLVELATSYGHA